MSRKLFLIIAACGFLLAVVSVFFGGAIHNAHENILITHLNEMDKINYYSEEDVNALTRLAVIVDSFFLITIGGLEIYVSRKTPFKIVKKLALVITALCIVLLVLGIFTLNNPVFFDFSKWGFAWVFVGLATVAVNALSVFVRAQS
jgi:hypothetical protein